MKPADYLLPAAFRSKREINQLKDRIRDLKDRLAKSRDARDHYKNRAKEAEAALRMQKRLHEIDPYRCRQILAEQLACHPSAAVRSHRAELGQTLSLIDLEDDMIWFSTTESYFEVGLHALDLILRQAPEIGDHERASILDLPCGHGRVMRWLHTCFPGADLYGCDIQGHGMDFCHEHFNATIVPPAARPSQMNMDVRFDLIWIGSLFTHLPRGEFEAFLAVLPKLLRGGGKVIFTTHGENGIRKFKEGFDFRFRGVSDKDILDSYDRDGFAFASYHHSPDYGVSFSARPYLEERLGGIPSLELTAFEPGGWGGFQDVVVCRKVTGG